MSSDPTTWGPQTNGFVCPIVDEIVESIGNDQVRFVSTDIDLDPDSPNGQNNGIFADRLASAWPALRALDAAFSRSGAEGDMLTRVGELTGTVQGGPTTTKVTAQCVLTTGTLLQAGVALASLTGKPDVLFTPVSDFTATTDGTHNVLFEALDTGPVICPSGASGLTTIATPISGWTAVSNSSAGVLGSTGATEAEFRAAQVEDLSRTGTSTAAAISVDIEAVAGVISCQTLENYTDHLDGNGLPPHSIEPVVYHDGTVVLTELAKAIYEAKGAGIQTFGTETASFVDADGVTQTVYYSVVTERPVYLSYVLSVGAGYVGDVAVKSSVVSTMTGKSKPGIDVIALTAMYQPVLLTGVLDVTTFRLGLSGPPSGTANIAISPREIATFDVSRVTVSS